jgi:outer membrane protein TolC
VATAGVLVDWEVFDWGRKKQEINAKRRAAEQARLAQEALERRIRVEVAQAVRQCAEAAQRVRVSTLAQQAAREGLREQQSALVREAVLLKDVLQSQTVLAAADDEQRRTLTGYWSARITTDKSTDRCPIASLRDMPTGPYQESPKSQMSAYSSTG